MIEVRDLTYTPPGAAAPAVSRVSFTVAPGEIFGLPGLRRGASRRDLAFPYCSLPPSSLATARCTRGISETISELVLAAALILPRGESRGAIVACSSAAREKEIR